ncbi:hypothetical protein MUG60_05415 [Kaistella montana]|nr:hypothetical protein [Kaistella montana]
MPYQDITDARVVALSDSRRVEGFFTCLGTERFKLFEAYDGRCGVVPDEFNVDGFRRRRGVDPRPGEIGCAMSHFLALREFAETPGSDIDLLLMAEDDARPTADLEPVLEAISHSPRLVDYAVLASPFEGPGPRPITSVGSRLTQLSLLASPVGPGGARSRYRLGRFDGTTWGTGLYLVSRRAARSYVDLVDDIGGISWVADESVFWAKLAGFDVLALVPNLCDWEGSSTIREMSDIQHHALQQQKQQSRQGSVTVMRSHLAPRTRLRYLGRRLKATAAELRDRKGEEG